MISTHALREEGDSVWRQRFPTAWDFYPRPPRGGRPGGRMMTDYIDRISTHALREEGDNVLYVAIILP